MTGSHFRITSRHRLTKPSSVRQPAVAVICIILTTRVSGHPHRAQWHEIGRHFKDRFHLHFGEGGDGRTADYDSDYPITRGTCHVQVVRSVSDWSHGVLTERSIQNACTLDVNWLHGWC